MKRIFKYDGRYKSRLFPLTAWAICVCFLSGSFSEPSPHVEAEEPKPIDAKGEATVSTLPSNRFIVRMSYQPQRKDAR